MLLESLYHMAASCSSVSCISYHSAVYSRISLKL